jgi:hypothetical protein
MPSVHWWILRQRHNILYITSGFQQKLPTVLPNYWLPLLMRLQIRDVWPMEVIDLVSGGSASSAVLHFCGTFRWLWPASARGHGRKDGHQSCGFCPINLADPSQSLSGYEDAKSVCRQYYRQAQTKIYIVFFFFFFLLAKMPVCCYG